MWLDRTSEVDGNLLIKNMLNWFKIYRIDFANSNETHMSIEFRGSEIVVEIEDLYINWQIVHDLKSELCTNLCPFWTRYPQNIDRIDDQTWNSDLSYAEETEFRVNGTIHLYVSYHLWPAYCSNSLVVAPLHMCTKG